MSPALVNQLSNQLAQQTNVDSDQLPIELTNLTGTLLQKMNNDCLLQIFSLKFLTLSDLCSLAETCVCFQQATQQVCPKNLNFNIDENGICTFETEKHLLCGRRRVQDIERFFKNFGSSVTAISISNKFVYKHKTQLRDATRNVIAFQRFALKLVTEYCVDTDALLRIDRMKITADLAVELKPIFRRVQRLNLNDLYVGDTKDTTLFAECTSLIELRVNNPDNCNLFLGNFFPKLERFSYGKEGLEITLKSLLAFIARHAKLKTLEILSPIDERCFKLIVQVIGDRCMELSIKMHPGRTNAYFIQPLQPIKSLTAVQLFLTSGEDLKFIYALTKLRELHLDYRAGSVSVPSHVIDIVSRLTTLEKFTIFKKDFALDEITFSKIVDIVKGRPNVLTLKCKIDFVYDPNHYDAASTKVKLINSNRNLGCKK